MAVNAIFGKIKHHFIKQFNQMYRSSDMHSGDSKVNYLSGDRNFRDFSQSLPAHVHVLPKMKPLPLPSTLFTIH
jgi:hypothetical protein